MFEKIKNTTFMCGRMLRDTYNEFMYDNAIKLSASLSFYTIFSLPPLLIILISLSGIFFGKKAVSGEIFGQINRLIGNTAALQIQELLKNIHLSYNNTFAAITGIVILIVSAMGVFGEIQSSLNYIWGIQGKPKRGLLKFVLNQLISFSMIGAVSFLLLVSLVINSITEVMNKRLDTLFPGYNLHVYYYINIIILFFIIAFLFALIFKTLPDGKISFKDAFVGSVFTTVLFMIGKFAIGFYLGHSKVASAYGAAGSVILLLLWVYYSAIILYFGAEFTKVYANTLGQKIIPNYYSIQVNKNLPDSPEQ